VTRTPALTALLARQYGPGNSHVATVTVGGAVAPGSQFDPDRIAEHYWRLHDQPRDAWEHEFAFAGEPAVDEPRRARAGRGRGVTASPGRPMRAGAGRAA
jgi:hypothetical protein